MAGYNRVILMGNLTRDPVSRTLPNTQTEVCDFALAVNRQWKDADGQARDEVLFIDCAAFGTTGRAIGEYLTKGRPLHVEGRLRLDRWEQDGQPRSKIRVIVERFRFVDRKPATDAAGPPPAKARPRGRAARKPVAAATAPEAADDIPF